MNMSEESRVDKKLLWDAWAILKRHANVNLPIGITALEATLTAIAPRLRAEGLREAAEMVDCMTVVELTLPRAKNALIARAQELDPK